ncbi:MAG: hypothetical protein RRZ69_05355, partial [Clostridia bacterium]
MRDKDPMFYRYWYLGEQTNLQGLIFPHFNSEKHVLHNIDINHIADITSQVIVAGDAANKN